MTATYQQDLTNTEYNGWTNYETWNVSLWIQNNQGLYDLARLSDDYQDFVDCVSEFMSETPDGVSFTSDKLNLIELNELIEDL